jgi:hypothetical protein
VFGFLQITCSFPFSEVLLSFLNSGRPRSYRRTVILIVVSDVMFSVGGHKYSFLESRAVHIVPTSLQIHKFMGIRLKRSVLIDLTKNGHLIHGSRNRSSLIADLGS